ncbi:hypothetical protein CsSME_00015605 [Camellia sinensis var. sinensis]
MATFTKNIHVQVRAQIEKSNAKYKLVVDVHKWKVLFEVGDLVWVVLSKERYPHGAYKKFSDRNVSPCEVLHKVNDNAYRVKLLPHLGISNTFNVQHLVPYLSDDSCVNTASIIID